MENVPVPFYSSEPSAEMLSDNPPEERIFVQKSIRSASLFAFRVTSESMRNAGILPGDTAVMRPCTSPLPDDIILASYGDDGEEMELRRYRPLNNGYAELWPENDSMGIIKVPLSDLSVHAVLTALRRDYRRRG